MFDPVPIGGTSPPLQVYELYNGGAKTVNYEMSLEPLTQVEAVSCVCMYMYLDEQLIVMIVGAFLVSLQVSAIIPFLKFRDIPMFCKSYITWYHGT